MYKLFSSIFTMVIFLIPSASPKNHRQALATQDSRYDDMVDEAPLVMMTSLTSRECAAECVKERCTYFYFNEDERLCSIYKRDNFIFLNYSVGWKYFQIEVTCPPAYTFRPSPYNCLSLYLPNSNYKTYNAKSTKCSEYGGSLAKIDTAEKQLSVEEYLVEFSLVPFVDYVLIQGRRNVHFGPFIYDDNTGLTYMNWGGQQPGLEFYLAIGVNDYKWYSISENSVQDAFFLCEADI